MAQAPDWDNLATWVKRARTSARLTQSDLKPLGGPSGTLVRQIEKSRIDSLSARTKTGLELALGWEIGAVDELLAGAAEPRLRGDMTPHMPGWRFGDPTPSEERADEGIAEDAAQLEDEVLARVSEWKLWDELTRRRNRRAHGDLLETVEDRLQRVQAIAARNTGQPSQREQLERAHGGAGEESQDPGGIE